MANGQMQQVANGQWPVDSGPQNQTLDSGVNWNDRLVTTSASAQRLRQRR